MKLVALTKKPGFTPAVLAGALHQLHEGHIDFLAPALKRLDPQVAHDVLIAFAAAIGNSYQGSASKLCDIFIDSASLYFSGLKNADLEKNKDLALATSHIIVHRLACSHASAFNPFNIPNFSSKTLHLLLTLQSPQDPKQPLARYGPP